MRLENRVAMLAAHQKRFLLFISFPEYVESVIELELIEPLVISTKNYEQKLTGPQSSAWNRVEKRTLEKVLQKPEIFL